MVDDAPGFDWAKMDSYQLSDADVKKLNQLVMPFLTAVQREFGDRMQQAMVNLIGSQLAHRINAGDTDGFYVVQCVNNWLRVAAKNHGAMPMSVQFDEELADEVRGVDEENHGSREDDLSKDEDVTISHDIEGVFQQLAAAPPTTH